MLTLFFDMILNLLRLFLLFLEIESLHRKIAKMIMFYRFEFFLKKDYFINMYLITDKIIELHLATLHVASRLSEVCSSINL